MNKSLLILLITQAVLTVNSKELRSKKLGREWTKTRQSNIQYKKTNNLFTSLLEQPHEFYESEFSTRFDHFRPLNQNRVNFTYNVNTHHFENYGPLFIYIKEAYDHSTRWIEEGLMVDIAEQTGAALLTFNIRYFGDNRPTDSASYEDLELLSIEQILADIAVFIRAVREAIPTAQYSRVITWGSGAGGSLATLARARYPHLVYAVWSSSGIIESSPYSWGPYDLLEYTFDINDGGQCRDLIASAYAEIDTLVSSNLGEELAERMNLCDVVDTDNKANIAALYESRLRTLMSYFNNFHYQGVLDFCDAMKAIEGQPLDSMAQWNRYIYPDLQCFNASYATLVARYSNVEWDQLGTDTGRRQWYFLQCTQIGSFLVSDQYTWLPGTVDFNYHLQKCQDLFGISFTYATVTDAFFTLQDEFTQRITNVIYTNGNLDPLRYFGRTYDPTNSVLVLNIDFASKSADLTSIDVDEPDSITDAKETIIGYITRWVADEPPTEATVSPTPELELEKI